MTTTRNDFWLNIKVKKTNRIVLTVRLSSSVVLQRPKLSDHSLHALFALPPAHRQSGRGAPASIEKETFLSE